MLVNLATTFGILSNCKHYQIDSRCANLHVVHFHEFPQGCALIQGMLSLLQALGWFPLSDCLQTLLHVHFSAVN